MVFQEVFQWPRQNYGPGTVRCWTWDGNTTDRGRYGVGPGTQTLRTRDGTMVDQRRKPSGPGTQLSRTGDGTMVDRRRKTYGPGTVFGNLCLLASQVPDKTEATEKGIYYTSLRESTLHNNPPEFSYSDERSTLRRMFAF